MEVKHFVIVGIGLVISLVSTVYYSYFKKETTEQKDSSKSNESEAEMYSVQEEHQDIHHCDAKKQVPIEDKTFCHDSFQSSSLTVVPYNNELLFDEKWKSVINQLSKNDKKRFYEKLSLPIKCFCKGFPSLSKNLDQGERLNDIVNYFQLPENDRIMILLANYGGGNPAMSVFEELKHIIPDLKVKDLCECLKTLDLKHALVFLKSLPYTDEVKISNIDKIHLTKFSYKLISFNANVKPWKDVAHELCNSKEDVSRIAKTIMLPNQYSPTEKLIEILSMRTSTTIQDFLRALKSCNINDAYELMCRNIITEIQSFKN
ncbi:uncharacterized protein LOC136089353 [Hydra vulgaris]|uniref:Uncharacterized protein LOC136089353 n=1 Tax=Hydra vulgaris TaxID=6087 RepID=A0ABM4DAK7_HYDVU